MNAERNDRQTWRVAAKILVSVVVGLYLIFLLMGKIPSSDKLGWSEYALIVFVALFVADFFDKLAEVSFGKEGLSLRMNKVEERQEEAENTLRAIRIALSGLINRYEFHHLEGLAEKGPYLVKFGNIFFDEVRRLDSIGFLIPTRPGGFNTIQEQHGSDGSEFDLKEYVQITDQGNSYLAMRKVMEAERISRT